MGTKMPMDYMNLGSNATVLRLIADVGSPGENVMFSDEITKINRKDSPQRRVILITDKAVYNVLPGTFKCKRRILLDRLEEITVSQVSDEFVVHVPSEYDYRYSSARKQEIVTVISDERKKLLKSKGRGCKIRETESVLLKEFCVTRLEAEKRRAEQGASSAPASDASPGEEGSGSGAASGAGDGGKSPVAPGKKLSVVDEEDEDEDDDEDPAALALARAKEAADAARIDPKAAAAEAATESAEAGRTRSETVGWAHKETPVTLADFELLKVIGRGSFGKVMQVRKKGDTSGEVLAMKVLVKSHIVARNQVEHTQAEREILESIDHPFLIKLKYAFQTPAKLYLVLPYLTGGELFFHLRKVKRFPEDQARFYAAEIAAGLGHLHSKGIIYRDLKPENILLDSDGHVCLTDFGLAKTLSKPGELTTTFCGTPEYLAPEIVRGDPHDKEVDWWSLGILLYEMLVGIPPFYSRNTQLMYDKIEAGRLQYPSFVSPAAREVLGRLLDRNPLTRLGCGSKDVESVFGHPFFKSTPLGELTARKLEPPFKPSVKGAADTSNFDKEFTSEPVVDSVAPTSALAGGGDGSQFQGFTYTGGGALDGGGAATGGADGEML